jgi:hypothetical protein
MRVLLQIKRMQLANQLWASGIKAKLGISNSVLCAVCLYCCTAADQAHAAGKQAVGVRHQG